MHTARTARFVSLALAACLFCLTAPAQSALPFPQPAGRASRVAQNPDLAPQTLLSGHLPRWVTRQNLSTQAVDTLTTLHLSLVLRRDTATDAAFDKLLAAQQDAASPLYHQWLMPEQVGALYGPTAADVNAVTSWAAGQGLSVDSVAPSRMIVEVSGSLAAISNALRTSFSYYMLGGKPQLAANTEPAIPTALAPVIRAIDGLADLPPAPASYGGSVKATDASSSSASGAQPSFTSGSSHFLSPGDFNIIYDVNPVLNSGNTGATIGTKAQHIAVIDRSDVSATDISLWAANVGLTSYHLNTIFATGTDPGQTANGDQLESTLDVNRTLSTAPGAITDLIVAPNSTGGIYAAAAYNVNTLVDPVMSISFYGCEANAGASNTAKWDTLFQAGAAEGISTFVCSGDSGAAGCASDFSAPPATTPVLSVNYICSSSYATCVGGTQFNDTANPATYWSSTNSSGRVSALSYIPEGAWNEAAQTSGTTTSYYVQSGGGGFSTFIAKPSWQTGTGVPADGHRDQPDISFTSAGHDGYYSCLAYSGGDCSKGYFEYLAGTSAATPDMAAITALLNTRSGSAHGNLNPLLYSLAATAPLAFHDVTVATSGVTNCSVAVASICNNSTPSQSALTGGLAGYAVTAGYDQATGLGSLDVANFLAAASPVTTTLALTATSTQLTASQSTTITATLTTAATSVAAPSGTVQFYVNGTALGSAVALSGNTASTTFSSATAGTYSITAIYSGDTYFTTSSATALTLTVGTAAQSFTMTYSAPSLSFTSGATSGNTDTVTLASTNGFTGIVALYCSISSSTAVYQPTCAVNPTSLTVPVAGSATAVVSISSTTATAALQTPASGHGRGIASVPSVVFAMFLGLIPMLRRRTRRLVPLVSVLTLSLGALVGCGGKTTTPAAQPPATLKSSAGSYVVTVVGTRAQTGTAAAVTVSSTFNLTIN